MWIILRSGIFPDRVCFVSGHVAILLEKDCAKGDTFQGLFSPLSPLIKSRQTEGDIAKRGLMLAWKISFLTLIKESPRLNGQLRSPKACEGCRIVPLQLRLDLTKMSASFLLWGPKIAHSYHDPKLNWLFFSFSIFVSKITKEPGLISSGRSAGQIGELALR